MSTIIQFPKNKSKRVAKLKKMEAKESAFIFSLMSLIVAALVANEALIKNNSVTYIVSDKPSVLNDANRALASTDSNSLSQNLSWEKKLSTRLADLPPLIVSRNPAQYSQNISELEKFSVGLLSGKYRITLNGEEIKSVQYVQSDSSFETRSVVDPKEVLAFHGQLFDRNFRKFEKVSEGAGTQVWRLLNSDNVETKQVVFTFENDRLEKLDIISPNERLPSSNGSGSTH